jgi:single-stranded-DNA-specific exonuclease
MGIVRPLDLRAKRWHLQPKIAPTLINQVPNLHPVFVQVLFNRGLVTPAQIQGFIEGHYLESDDPFLLPDMDKAVARIQQAIEQDERIVVYGDFDADGVTSTVLLTEALRGLGISRRNAQPYIPDRVDEGYGLNVDALTHIKETVGADLVISVDCGIRSVYEVEHANSMGLDMIVTDHHSIGRKIPPAYAVINPKLAGSTYPEKMLAGVGIAYKLAQACYQAMPNYVRFDLNNVLDLVAIGTVADLAPLLGENRKLVRDGLRVMNGTKRAGIAALGEVANVKGGAISAETIAFTIGPRINAAGRLSHAYDAAKLLAAHDRRSAMNLARDLEALNRKRQKLTEDLGVAAEGMIDEDAPILIAAGENFVAGVVGLVASRLADKHYRPAIIIEKGEGESRGSCRSIDEFHITDALDELSHLLLRHGGHAAAAGFTLENDNLIPFTEQMTEIARTALGGKELLPSIDVDAEIDLDQIDWALYENLQQLEPCGMENRQPIFMSSGVEVLSHRVVGKDQTHLQMEVTNGRAGFKTIAFRQASWATQMPQYVDIVYSINVNEWNGRRTLQLMIKDIRPAR